VTGLGGAELELRRITVSIADRAVNLPPEYFPAAQTGYRWAGSIGKVASIRMS